MSSRSTQGRVPHWAWIILGAGFLDIFINYSVRLGYGVVLPEMLRDMGLSRTAGGTIYNAYLGGYILLAPLAGWLADRIGVRLVIPACLAVVGIGVLLLSKASGLGEACLAYAIAGMGAAGIWTPVLAVAQKWFAPQRRGLALGILGAGYGLGFAAVGVLFPIVVLYYNWRCTWLVLGGAALALVAVNAAVLRNDPESSGAVPWGDKGGISTITPTPGPETAGSFTAVIRNPTFWWIGGSYFSIAFALYGFTTFMVDYARSEAGLSLGAASFLATIHGSFQVLGVLTILPLSDRLGRKRTILFANVFLTLVLLAIVAAGTGTAVLSCLVGALAVVYGATFPIYGACAGDYFPRPLIGTVIGAWTPLYGAGAILSHWASGAVRDTLGSYQWAFLLDAAMAGAAVVFFLFVRKNVENSVKETASCP